MACAESREIFAIAILRQLPGPNSRSGDDSILIFALMLYVVVSVKLACSRLSAMGDGETEFRSLAEAIPLIVWTAGLTARRPILTGAGTR